jgi:hypothetical protein
LQTRTRSIPRRCRFARAGTAASTPPRPANCREYVVVCVFKLSASHFKRPLSRFCRPRHCLTKFSPLSVRQNLAGRIADNQNNISGCAVYPHHQWSLTSIRKKADNYILICARVQQHNLGESRLDFINRRNILTPQSSRGRLPEFYTISLALLGVGEDADWKIAGGDFSVEQEKNKYVLELVRRMDVDTYMHAYRRRLLSGRWRSCQKKNLGCRGFGSLVLILDCLVAGSKEVVGRERDLFMPYRFKLFRGAAKVQ